MCRAALLYHNYVDNPHTSEHVDLYSVLLPFSAVSVAPSVKSIFQDSKDIPIQSIFTLKITDMWSEGTLPVVPHLHHGATGSTGEIWQPGLPIRHPV